MTDWLDVPFSEKDEAKAAGARWDVSERRWYAPPGRLARLERWKSLPDLPDLLPGEDRMFGAGLFVDLIPETSWYQNTRTILREESWERVRRMVYRRAGFQCEACHVQRADGARLEAHERWSYKGGTQELRRLICLCSDCHTSTHFGLANIRGVAEQARQHLMTVTGMSDGQADAHIEAAFDVWRLRSRLNWRVDVSILKGMGLRLTPEAADARDAAAEAAEAVFRRAASGPVWASSGSDEGSSISLSDGYWSPFD